MLYIVISLASDLLQSGLTLSSPSMFISAIFIKDFDLFIIFHFFFYFSKILWLQNIRFRHTVASLSKCKLNRIHTSILSDPKHIKCKSSSISSLICMRSLKHVPPQAFALETVLNKCP